MGQVCWPKVDPDPFPPTSPRGGGVRGIPTPCARVSRSLGPYGGAVGGAVRPPPESALKPFEEGRNSVSGDPPNPSPRPSHRGPVPSRPRYPSACGLRGEVRHVDATPGAAAGGDDGDDNDDDGGGGSQPPKLNLRLRGRHESPGGPRKKPKSHLKMAGPCLPTHSSRPLPYPHPLGGPLTPAPTPDLPWSRIQTPTSNIPYLDVNPRDRSQPPGATSSLPWHRPLLPGTANSSHPSVHRPPLSCASTSSDPSPEARFPLLSRTYLSTPRDRLQTPDDPGPRPPPRLPRVSGPSRKPPRSSGALGIPGNTPLSCPSSAYSMHIILLSVSDSPSLPIYPRSE